jgi:hypothetical protein
VIVSRQANFVMLAPWKAASQTVRQRLQSYNNSPYPAFFYFNPYLNRVVHQHITCAEYLCLPEARLGYLVASFVRNPYDRVFSGFQQLQTDIREQPYTDFPEPWIRDLVMRQLTENFSQLCQAGFNFDRWLALVGEEQIYDVGRNSNFPLHPAHYWTHVAGQLIANFIGKVESFEVDFGRFLSLVGIHQVPTINLNVSGPLDGPATNPCAYRYVDRMNSKSIDKINRLFASDFEFFGYDRVPPARISPSHYPTHLP